MGDFFNDVVEVGSFGLIEDVTGSEGAADAAEDAAGVQSAGAIEAARIQTEAGERALALLRGDLAPFREGFGAEDITGLRGLATDPQQQVDFLTSNPFFQTLRDQARESTFRTQSAGGALGSSGTDEILQNQFLSIGNDLINQQINRQLPLLQSAQNAAAQTGTGGAQILSNIGAAGAQGATGAANANSAGIIGASNARVQGSDTAIGGISALAQLFSDSRLKENKVKLGEYKGLDVYKWDWNKEAKELGLEGSSVGHIADEVMGVHPELVHLTDSGYLAMNYETEKTVRVH